MDFGEWTEMKSYHKNIVGATFKTKKNNQNNM